MNTNQLASALLTLAGGFAAASAQATELWDPTQSSTTTLDGSSVRLDGTLKDVNADVQPWTAQLYAATGDCMRLFVSSTTFDAKLTVIAPNGTVYRDDDSGGLNRPLVKVASAPTRGWYTVQVAEFEGKPVNANFTLLYGRYTPGNVNCASGTGPLFSADATETAKNAAASQ